METLNDMISAMGEHWPFFSVAMVIYTCGIVFKKFAWTAERAAKNKFFWFMRATLPIHPLIAGVVAALALRWAPGIDSFPQIVLYYVAAGGCAAWLVNIIKYYLASKGIKIPENED